MNNEEENPFLETDDFKDSWVRLMLYGIHDGWDELRPGVKEQFMMMGEESDKEYLDSFIAKYKEMFNEEIEYFFKPERPTLVYFKQK